MATKKRKPIKAAAAEKLNLSNPVVLAANRIRTLLDQIPAITTAFDYKSATLTVYVSDINKYLPVRMLLKREHDVGCGLKLNVKAYDISDVEPEEITPPTWTVTDECMFGYAKTLLSGFVYKPAIGLIEFEPKFTEVKSRGTKDVFRFIEMPPVAMCYASDTLQNPNGVSSELPADLFKLAFHCDAFMVSTFALTVPSEAHSINLPPV